VNATVDEIASAGRESDGAVVAELLRRDGVTEAFALQTCNRVEAYVVTDSVAAARRALSGFAPEVRDKAVVELDHEGSLEHLMRVAAGLESLVLGEDQIIGQLKRAIESSRAVGGIGPMLDDALTKAVHVGERARTETGINEGIVSLGSAAVELAAAERSLDGSTALVVGAGEMGRLAARALDAAGVEDLVVANRTIPHAEHLAAELDADARAIGLHATAEAVAAADIVITATGSPEFVLDSGTLADAGETVVIDIAQPRDVDPAVAALDGVVLRDIDALESVTAKTRTNRAKEAEAVEAMIEEELDRLLDAYKRKRADDAISAMYAGAERVKSRELDTALTKLESQGDLTVEQRETVAALADALVGQLLAAPTKSLREAAAEDDWTTIQTAMNLFDPEFSASLPGAGDSGEPAEPGELSDPGERGESPRCAADVPTYVIERSSDD
jgi:glutamyl-tRNA reductase